MPRIARLILISLVAMPALATAQTMAQAPGSAPYDAPAAVAGAGQPDPLPGLPHPPDLPASLFQNAPPTASFSGDPLPGPYFDGDPRLDPPPLPAPGWLADVEVGIDLPHVSNNLQGPVTLNGGTRTVQLPSAHLDWSAAPRLSVGYRLPEGFGEFALTYRFLASDGSGTILGLDAPAVLRSRFDLNMVDLDYASNELTIWECWGMKWRLGLRGSDIFFDSHADESRTAAAGGSTIFESGVSNNFWGIGPHGALELERRFSDWGLSIVGRIDLGSVLGRVNQTFEESSTVGGAGHYAEDIRTNACNSPMVTASLGAAWRPPSCSAIRVFLGYEYEHWWTVGHFPDGLSNAEVYDQGVLLRADFNY